MVSLEPSTLHTWMATSVAHFQTLEMERGWGVPHMALGWGAQGSKWQQHSRWEIVAQLPTNCPPLWYSVKDSEETNLCVFSWLKFYMEQEPQSSHQASLCWVSRQ